MRTTCPRCRRWRSLSWGRSRYVVALCPRGVAGAMRCSHPPSHLAPCWPQLLPVALMPLPDRASEFFKDLCFFKRLLIFENNHLHWVKVGETEDFNKPMGRLHSSLVTWECPQPANERAFPVHTIGCGWIELRKDAVG